MGVRIGIRLSILLLVVFNSGCFSNTPSRFYRLSTISLESSKNFHEIKNIPQRIVIGVGPMNLPEYLDKPQIALRVGEHEIVYSEFDRWAGSLRQEIQRTVAENLGTLLRLDEVYTYPWERPQRIDYQLLSDIVRFDVTESGEAVFEIRWQVIGRNSDQVIPMRKSIYTEKVSAPTYEERVTALNRTLLMFSDEVSHELEGKLKKN